MITCCSHSAFNFYALIRQNLTGEFKRKTYPASGNLVTDSWSWQSFVWYCDIFNCLFPLDVQNEIKLLSRFFCYSWLVCLLGFWLTNAPTVRVIRNTVSDSIVLKNKLTHFTLPDATGKTNRFPFLDILGYLKNTNKYPKFGRVRQVPIRELRWEFPGWTCLTLPNLGFLWVFFKNPKISKNGNPLFFPVNSVN